MPEPSEAATPPECLRCHAPMISLGQMKFRTGGASGGWQLLFGEWAELSEHLLPLDVYVCERCRATEFRLPTKAADALIEHKRRAERERETSSEIPLDDLRRRYGYL